MPTRTLALMLALALAGCANSPHAQDDPVDTNPGPAPDKSKLSEAIAEAEKDTQDPPKVDKKPASGQPDSSHMGPRISRSVGVEGGVVVLWPRIIPASDDPAITELATTLQSRMSAVVQRTAPDAPMDRRPEPQRVCPQAGCKATSAGVLLVHQDGGCIAVALIGDPDKGPVQLIPWGGRSDLKSEMIAFRDYPEKHITIRDFAPCDKLIDALFNQEKAVEAGLRKAMGLPPAP